MINLVPPPPPGGKVIYLGDFAERYPKVRDILYYHGTGTARANGVYKSAYTEYRRKFFEKNKMKNRQANNKRATPPTTRK